MCVPFLSHGFTDPFEYAPTKYHTHINKHLYIYIWIMRMCVYSIFIHGSTDIISKYYNFILNANWDTKQTYTNTHVHILKLHFPFHIKWTNVPLRVVWMWTCVCVCVPLPKRNQVSFYFINIILVVFLFFYFIFFSFSVLMSCISFHFIYLYIFYVFYILFICYTNVSVQIHHHHHYHCHSALGGWFDSHLCHPKYSRKILYVSHSLFKINLICHHQIAFILFTLSFLF